MSFNDREEFDQFIAEMEREYFKTSKLAMTPYSGTHMGI
jgi:hypothetical protein